MHHGLLIWGFYKGKLAKNEPNIHDFQNMPKTRLKKYILERGVSSTIFGVVTFFWIRDSAVS